MARITDRKLILVTRKTRLQELIVRYNTADQARFYIEHQGLDFTDFEQEDARYHTVVNQIYRMLDGIGSVQTLDRVYLPNYLFSKEDILIVVGQDGLVVNAMKYLDGQPLIGVNPDSKRWDGVLLPFDENGLDKVVTDVIMKRRDSKSITLARVDLNDGQQLYAVNDFFIGKRTHVSARYQLCYNNQEERQSSSGIIVSTGLGSTGWLKSVFAGAAGIIGVHNGRARDSAFPWDADYLFFSVREPYPSNWTQAGLVSGRIDHNHAFRIISQMADNGVIFSDGIEEDCLVFNAGTEATVCVADRKAALIV